MCQQVSKCRVSLRRAYSVANGLELFAAVESRDGSHPSRDSHKPLGELGRNAYSAARTLFGRGGSGAAGQFFPSADCGQELAPPCGRRITNVRRFIPPVRFGEFPGPPVASEAVGVGQ